MQPKKGESGKEAKKLFGLKLQKLDWVGPVDNRPSTNNLHLFVKKKCDKWHVTCDTGHVKCDIWQVVEGGGGFENFLKNSVS